MAIAYVKELGKIKIDAFGVGGDSASESLSLSAAPAAGNTVVLFFGARVGSATGLTVTVTD